MSMIGATRERRTKKRDALFSSTHPSGMSMRWPSLATTASVAVSHTVRSGEDSEAVVYLILTNDRPTQGHVPAKVDVAGNSKMV